MRWNHIRDGLYGASLSTAKRAVKDLKDAGLIRVIKRGFNNQNGRACAPIYEMAPLTERVTQVNHSPSERTGQTEERTSQTEERTGQTEERTSHPGDLLDGSIDGPIDKGERSPFTDDLEPRHFCDAHMPHGTGESCRRCKTHRINHERWMQRNPGHGGLVGADRKAQDYIRRAAELDYERTSRRRDVSTSKCRHCDHGWLIGDDGTPLEPATHCPHCTAAINGVAGILR